MGRKLSGFTHIKPLECVFVCSKCGYETTLGTDEQNALAWARENKRCPSCVDYKKLPKVKAANKKVENTDSFESFFA